jgi:hypothetical protein
MATVLGPPKTVEDRVVLHNISWHTYQRLLEERDITSSSVTKRAVFAQFGVPEVWRYDGTKIEILTLTAGSYIRSDASLVLPVFTAEALTNLVADSPTLDRPEWMNKVLEWARGQKESH